MEGSGTTLTGKPLAELEAAFPKMQGPDGILSCRRGRAPVGRPVLLLPGASGTSEFFCLAAPLLRDGGLDPILVDYPGTRPPRELARHTEDLVKALDLRNPAAVGCSYSAWWLQHARSDGPLAHLVLCNGFVEAEDLKANPLFDHAAISATPADRLREEWRERAASAPVTALSELLLLAMTEWLAPEDLKGRLLEVTSSGRVPAADRFTGPVTLIDCGDDPIVTAPARRRFREDWTSADHMRTAGGHYPYVNAPEEFARAVLTVV